MTSASPVRRRRRRRRRPSPDGGVVYATRPRQLRITSPGAAKNSRRKHVVCCVIFSKHAMRPSEHARSAQLCLPFALCCYICTLFASRALMRSNARVPVVPSSACSYSMCVFITHNYCTTDRFAVHRRRIRDHVCGARCGGCLRRLNEHIN